MSCSTGTTRLTCSERAARIARSRALLSCARVPSLSMTSSGPSKQMSTGQRRFLRIQVIIDTSATQSYI